MDTEIPTIYLDGECVLCDRSALFIYNHSRPGSFQFATLQRHPQGEGRSTLVVRIGEETYTRGKAILVIASRMTPPYPRWGKLLGLLPLPVLNGIYRVVAAIRYRVWGRKACSLPTGVDRRYFLD